MTTAPINITNPIPWIYFLQYAELEKDVYIFYKEHCMSSTENLNQLKVTWALIMFKKF